MGAWFRIDASIDLAVDDAGGPGLAPVEGRRLAAEAFASLEALSSRRDAEVKRALGLVLDAVCALERELELLQRRSLLQARGVDLRRHRVHIGADGMVAEGPLGRSGAATLHLSLPLRGQQHLLSLPVEIEPDERTLRFEADPAARDTLVAFLFEQQRMERRRELDAAAG